MSPSSSLNATESQIVEAVPTELFIGGRWRAGSEGGQIPVADPSTGTVFAHVADATVADGEAALAAASGVAVAWAATPPRDRGEILRRAFDLVIERREDLALLMTLENGKALADSRAEVTYGAEFLRWFSEEAVRIAGRYAAAPNGASHLLTMAQPVGPCLFITPWNFPLAMGTRKIGPAIAAGCTMVVKPASTTPLSMLALTAIMAEAGLPDGVLNVITTTKTAEVIEPLVRDPRLRKLSFTGSTAVGRVLMEQSAHQLLRVSLELGGNAPFVVFADADLAAAVDGALLAKMRNGGEACTAANRFLVHESVAEDFTAALTTRMDGLTVGRGTEPDVDVGPLVDAATRDKVAALVDDAVARGAQVRTRPRDLGDAGHFFAPTVLTGVDPAAELCREEIFGPVAPISTFASDEEAIAAANDTEFGLVAYVYTRDLDRALRVSERLEVGMVGLNTGLVSNAAAPFGGVKHSGFGREGGVQGIDEYLQTKYIAVPR